MKICIYASFLRSTLKSLFSATVAVTARSLLLLGYFFFKSIYFMKFIRKLITGTRRAGGYAKVKEKRAGVNISYRTFRRIANGNWWIEIWCFMSSLLYVFGFLCVAANCYQQSFALTEKLFKNKKANKQVAHICMYMCVAQNFMCICVCVRVCFKTLHRLLSELNQWQPCKYLPLSLNGFFHYYFIL